ncbi:MAG TPA: hypothetical protein DFS52_31110 [Myxococcales bacterium]|nr:hypothetical protein [Myxococcales bacterium]
MAAVERFESSFDQFKPEDARQNAEQFGRAQFKARIAASLDRALRIKGLMRHSDPDVAPAVH